MIFCIYFSVISRYASVVKAKLTEYRCAEMISFMQSGDMH